MIYAEIRKCSQGSITGFRITSHGEGKACAAVSMLAINTVNSIELFTEDDIACEYNEAEGGYLNFALAPGPASEGASLLLRVLELGLRSVRESYPGEIQIETISEGSGDID